MASTYSPLLRLELQATADNPDTWGIINNAQIGTLLEQAVAGVAVITMPNADVTLTALQGAVDQSRAAVLVLQGGPLTAQRAVRVPASAKAYTVLNALTFPVEIRTVANPGVVVAAGLTTQVWCDGATVRPAITGLASLSVAGVLTAALLDVGSIAVGGSSIWSPGDVKFSLAPTQPGGWLWANGQTVSRVTYAALFAVLGITYGPGDGATTFRLPDMRGRAPIGYDNIGGIGAAGVAPGVGIGFAGGSWTHTLAAGEMPLHNHGVNDGGHNHGVNDGTHGHTGFTDGQGLHAHNAPTTSGTNYGGGPNVGFGGPDIGFFGNLTDQQGVHSHNVTTYAAFANISLSASGTGISIQSTGGGAAHTNVQPSFGGNWLIKV